MKRILLIGTVVIAVASFAALAQQPAHTTRAVLASYTAPTGPAFPAQTEPPIALLDLQFIFKNWDGHQAKQRALKEEFVTVNDEVKKERQAIRKLQEELTATRPGSPEHDSLNSRVAKAEEDLKERTRMLQREFVEKEAAMLHQTYQDVAREVEQYCRKTGTSIVLKHDTAPVDPENCNDIVRLINREVIWHAPKRDITQDILRELNSRAQDPKKKRT